MPLENSQREAYVDIRAWLSRRHKLIHKSEYLSGGQGAAHNRVRSIAEITFPRALSAYRELRSNRPEQGWEFANKTQRRKVAQAILFACDETLQASIWGQLSRLRKPKNEEVVAEAAVTSFKAMDGVIDLIKEGYRKFPDKDILGLTASELAQKTYGTESFRSDQGLIVMTGLAVVAIGELTPEGEAPQLPDPLITKLGVAPEWQQPRLR